MRSLLRRLAFGIVGLALTGSLARVRAGVPPLSYLTGHGARATPVVALTWGVLIISVAVTVIIAVLLAAALWRRRSKVWQPGERLDVSHPHGAMWWVWVGVAISTLVLLGTCVWTMLVLAQIASPREEGALHCRDHRPAMVVAGALSERRSARSFTTANEIHIPAGVPVRLQADRRRRDPFLLGAAAGRQDGRHSRPDQRDLARGAQPGIYRGQCTEYCGVQHAHMGLFVVAQAPADFARWWAHQLRLASAADTAQARAGHADFNMHCGSCHARARHRCRGRAWARSQPSDARGTTIAAGTLPNDRPTLAHWIADPQGVKPGNLMPKPELTGAGARRHPGLSADAELDDAVPSTYERAPTVGRRGSSPPLAEKLREIWETEPGFVGWLSTVDHKEIGIRYIVTAFAFLIVGGIEALVFRAAAGLVEPASADARSSTTSFSPCTA